MNPGEVIAFEIAKGLADASAAVGNGETLLVEVRTPGGLQGPASNRVEGPPVVRFGRGVLLTYTTYERENTIIAETDRRLLLEIMDPLVTTQDLVYIGGKKYDVIRPDTIEPGGVPLMQVIQVRG